MKTISLIPIAGLAASALAFLPPSGAHAGFVSINPTDVWTTNSGLTPSVAQVNGNPQSVAWVSSSGTNPGHTVTATAFSFPVNSNGTPNFGGGSTTSGVTIDTSLGNGGLGVCSNTEAPCSGNGNTTNINFSNVGNNQTYDVLQLTFSTAKWIPVGISLAATSASMSYFIVGDNDGSLGDGDDVSLGTFTPTNANCGSNQANAKSGTSSNGINFLCYSDGNFDQFEFLNQTTAFQDLFVAVDSTVAGTGGESMRVHDLEGVLPVPEPTTLAVFGIGLLGLSLARRRKAN